MPTMDASLFDFRIMDDLSRRDTPLHRLDARTKLLTTLAFLVAVVSFDKYHLSELLPFLLYPVALAAVGGIPASVILKKLLLVSPFAVMVGLFNPFLDTQPMAQLGSVVVSGGWISFFSILLRFALTVGAALLLVAVSGFLSAVPSLGTPGSSARVRGAIALFVSLPFRAVGRGRASGPRPRPAQRGGTRDRVGRLRPASGTFASAHSGPRPADTPGHALSRVRGTPAALASVPPGVAATPCFSAVGWRCSRCFALFPFLISWGIG